MEFSKNTKTFRHCVLNEGGQNMYSLIIGIMKPGTKDKLDSYYDRPFDLFEEYYELSELYRTPAEWYPILGERKQMDWGAWLSVCNYEQVRELFRLKPSCIAKIIPATGNEEFAKIGKRESSSLLPQAEWYGIMEVEEY